MEGRGWKGKGDGREGWGEEEDAGNKSMGGEGGRRGIKWGKRIYGCGRRY